MRILFIHQNFPGQFRELAPHLCALGHDVVAICAHNRPVNLPCRILRYSEPQKIGTPVPFGTEIAHESFLRGQQVAQLAYQLSQEGWTPDVIAAHSGWGETLGIKNVWPQVPQLLWPELWILPEHGGYGVDPQKPPATFPHILEQLGRNTLTRAALSMASMWVLPTQHQVNSFPEEFRDHRMNLIHEGIDTSIAIPNQKTSYEIRGHTITSETPTITFVNRNLERLRGFDTFMRALPKIFAHHDDVKVLIVGDSGVGYGGGYSGTGTLREDLIAELKSQLDFGRLFFLGRIPHPQLITLLQLSWAHIYLSYPFVLGWSLLEAMACGCPIVGSYGMPVEEVLAHRQNALLVNNNDHDSLANSVLELLGDPALRVELGNSARKTSLAWDKRITLQQSAQLLLNLGANSNQY